MEKLQKVFKCLALAFLKRDQTTARKILAVLKEDSDYKKNLKSISIEILVKERRGPDMAPMSDYQVSEAMVGALEGLANDLCTCPDGSITGLDEPDKHAVDDEG